LEDPSRVLDLPQIPELSQSGSVEMDLPQIPELSYNPDTRHTSIRTKPETVEIPKKPLPAPEIGTLSGTTRENVQQPSPLPQEPIQSPEEVKGLPPSPPQEITPIAASQSQDLSNMSLPVIPELGPAVVQLEMDLPQIPELETKSEPTMGEKLKNVAGVASQALGQYAGNALSYAGRLSSLPNLTPLLVGPTGIPQAVGNVVANQLVQKPIEKAISPSINKGLDTLGITPSLTGEQNPVIRIGEHISKSSEEYYKDLVDPRLANSFIWTTVPQGIASLGAMALAGPLGPEAALMVGFGMEGEDAYQREIERQKKAGEESNPDKALAKSLAYAAVSTGIEAKFGIGRILNKAKEYFGKKGAEAVGKKIAGQGLSWKTVGNFLKERVKDAGSGFTEEASQRFTQDLIIDQQPDLKAIVTEGGAGAIAEALFGGLFHVGGRLHAAQAANQAEKALDRWYAKNGDTISDLMARESIDRAGAQSKIQYAHDVARLGLKQEFGMDDTQVDEFLRETDTGRRRKMLENAFDGKPIKAGLNETPPQLPGSPPPVPTQTPEQTALIQSAQDRLAGSRAKLNEHMLATIQKHIDAGRSDLAEQVKKQYEASLKRKELTQQAAQRTSNVTAGLQATETIIPQPAETIPSGPNVNVIPSGQDTGVSAAGVNTINKTQIDILKQSKIPEKEIPDYVTDTLANGQALRKHAEAVQSGKETITEAGTAVANDWSTKKTAPMLQGTPALRGVAQIPAAGTAGKVEAPLQTGVTSQPGAEKAPIIKAGNFSTEAVKALKQQGLSDADITALQNTKSPAEIEEISKTATAKVLKQERIKKKQPLLIAGFRKGERVKYFQDGKEVTATIKTLTDKLITARTRDGRAVSGHPSEFYKVQPKGEKLEELSRKPLVALVRDNGGIRSFKKGYGNEDWYAKVPIGLRNKNGLPLDEIAQQAMDAGLIPQNSSIDVFVEKLAAEAAAETKPPSVESLINDAEQERIDKDISAGKREAVKELSFTDLNENDLLYGKDGVWYLVKTKTPQHAVLRGRNESITITEGQTFPVHFGLGEGLQEVDPQLYQGAMKEWQDQEGKGLTPVKSVMAPAEAKPATPEPAGPLFTAAVGKKSLKQEVIRAKKLEGQESLRKDSNGLYLYTDPTGHVVTIQPVELIGRPNVRRTKSRSEMIEEGRRKTTPKPAKTAKKAKASEAFAALSDEALEAIAKPKKQDKLIKKVGPVDELAELEKDLTDLYGKPKFSDIVPTGKAGQNEQDLQGTGTSNGTRKTLKQAALGYSGIQGRERESLRLQSRVQREGRLQRWIQGLANQTRTVQAKWTGVRYDPEFEQTPVFIQQASRIAVLGYETVPITHDQQWGGMTDHAGKTVFLKENDVRLAIGYANHEIGHILRQIKNPAMERLVRAVNLDHPLSQYFAGQLEYSGDQLAEELACAIISGRTDLEILVDGDAPSIIESARDVLKSIKPETGGANQPTGPPKYGELSPEDQAYQQGKAGWNERNMAGVGSNQEVIPGRRQETLKQRQVQKGNLSAARGVERVGLGALRVPSVDERGRGEGGTLSSSRRLAVPELSLEDQTYHQAKTTFEKGLAIFDKQGKTATDFIKWAVDKWGQPIIPHLVRFKNEMSISGLSNTSKEPVETTRQQKENPIEDRRAETWGFTTPQRDSAGWAQYDFENEKIEAPPHKKGFVSTNSITLGKAPNGRWTFATQLGMSESGGGRPTHLGGPRFNSREEALSEAIKEFRSSIPRYQKANKPADAKIAKDLYAWLDSLESKSSELTLETTTPKQPKQEMLKKTANKVSGEFKNIMDQVPDQSIIEMTYTDKDGVEGKITGDLFTVSGHLRFVSMKPEPGSLSSHSEPITDVDGKVLENIKSVRLVKSGVDVMQERRERQRGELAYKQPKTRDEYEQTLWDLARQVQEAKVKDDKFGIKIDSTRSLQIEKQFDDVADEIQLAKTKRAYIMAMALTKVAGKPLKRVSEIWDLRTMDGATSAGRAPNPSDFDPNPEIRKKRQPVNPLNLWTKKELENSLAEAEFDVKHLKNKGTDKYLRRVRIIEERKKQLANELYYEAVIEKRNAGKPLPEDFQLETTTPAQLKQEALKKSTKEKVKAGVEKPLAGTAGDMTADLFGKTEGETPLFNAPAPKTVPSKVFKTDLEEPVVKAVDVLGKDVNTVSSGFHENFSEEFNGIEPAWAIVIQQKELPQTVIDAAEKAGLKVGKRPLRGMVPAGQTWDIYLPAVKQNEPEKAEAAFNKLADVYLNLRSAQTSPATVTVPGMGTKPIETSTKKQISDFGEKIGGARKDQWKDRNLAVKDIEQMTDREMMDLVKKDEIYPVPDYSEMTDRIAAGMGDTLQSIAGKSEFNEAWAPEAPAAISLLIKKIRDSMPAQPKTSWTRDDIKKYIEVVGMVRDALARTQTYPDLKQLIPKIFGPDIFIGSEYYRTLNNKSPYYNQLWLLGNNFLRAAQISDRDFAKAMLEVSKTGFPEKSEPWRKQYMLSNMDKARIEEMYRYKEGQSMERIYTYRVATAGGQQVAAFPVKAEAQAYIDSNKGKTVLTDRLGRNIQLFDTKDGAVTWARENATTKAKEAGITLTRPMLSGLKRTGADYRNGKDITEKDFQDAFSFRGGEFGNWLSQEDRQQSLNAAYDALRDLADLMGVDPKAISLNGELGFAFGARGQGGAAAHYEPAKIVINLTKWRGAGALAHEWAHAVDDYFGRLSGDKSKASVRKSDYYVSYGVTSTSKLRPEMVEAWKNMMDAITRRSAEAREVLKQAEVKLVQNTRNIQSWADSYRKTLETNKATPDQLAQWDNLVKLAINEDPGPPIYKDTSKSKRDKSWKMSFKVLESMNELSREVTGRQVSSDVMDALKGNLDWRKRYTTDRDNALAGKVQRTIDTDFLAAARKLDKSRSKPYWSTLHEMFARAYESYIQDGLIKTGKQDDYLVHSADNQAYTVLGLDDAKQPRPYPEKQDRDAINKAFDSFIDTLDTKVTDKGVAMFGDIAPRPTEDEVKKFAGSEGVLKQDLPKAANQLMLGLDAVEKASTTPYVHPLTAKRAITDHPSSQGSPQPAEAWQQAFTEEGDTISSLVHKYITREIPVWKLKGQTVKNPRDFAALLMPLRSPYMESMKVAYLDNRRRIIDTRIVTVGVLDSSLVHPREVLANIPEGTSSLIIAHNHPSGDPTPSAEDIRITKQLLDAAKIAGINVMDHVITNGGKYTSLRESGIVEFLDRTGPVPKSPIHIKKGAEPVIPEMQEQAPWEKVRRQDLLRIRTSYDIKELANILRQASGNEYGHIIFLDTRSHIIAVSRIKISENTPQTIGKQVIQTAGKEGAASFLVDWPVDTSAAVRVGHQLIELGEQLNIQLIDFHNNEHQSFRESGLLAFHEPLDTYGTIPVDEKAQNKTQLHAGESVLTGAERLDTTGYFADISPAKEKDPYTGTASSISNRRLSAVESARVAASLSRISKKWNKVVQENAARRGPEIYGRETAALFNRSVGLRDFSIAELGLKHTLAGNILATGETSLEAIGEVGAEGGAFVDKKQGVVYKVYRPKRNGLEGDGPEGIGLTNKLVVRSPATREKWLSDMTAVARYGDIQELVDRIRVVNAIGSTPTEILGMSEEGFLVTKQPLGYSSVNDPRMDDKFIEASIHGTEKELVREKEMGLVRVPVELIQNKYDSSIVYWVTKVNGKPYLLTDIRRSNIIGDRYRRARANDIIVGEIPARALLEPKLKALLDKVDEDKMPERSLVAFGDISPRAPAPVFYSKLRRVIQEKMPNRAMVSQVKGLIDPAKGSGVKQEEIYWTGLQDFLESKKLGDMVTKQEVLDSLRDIQIKEVLKGDETAAKAFDRWTDEEVRQHLVDVMGADAGDVAFMDRQQLEDWAEENIDPYDAADARDDSPAAAKYKSYTVPGAENYKELLLTFPEQEDEATLFRRQMREKYRPGWASKVQRLNITPKELIQLEEIEKKEEAGELPLRQLYQSSHWDESNVFLHVRFDDRTTPDGKKMLFIEEIQSDWHQAGRQKGYGNKLIGQLPAEYKYFIEVVRGIKGTEITKQELTRSQAIERLEGGADVISEGPAGEQSVLRADEFAFKKGVPNAPFKGEAWSRLAMKRMIRWAAENSIPANDAWIEVTKPESVRQKFEDYFGSKLTSVIPLEIMDVSMLPLLKHNQVRQAIIKIIPVDVMNMLSKNGFSAEDILSKPNMIGDALPVDTRPAIARGLTRAMKLVAADLRAKTMLSLSEKSTTRKNELLPALIASDLNAREIIGLLSPSTIYRIDELRGDKAAPRLAIANLRTEPSIAAGGITSPSRELPPAELAVFLNSHNAIITDNRLDSTSKYRPPDRYSAISWTTGETQAERYDLSKQVEEIRVSPYLKGAQKWNEGARYEVMAFQKGNNHPVITRDAKDETGIAELIGKELAKRAVGEIEKTETSVTYSGLDLKVGGTGMSGFYDKILSSIANDITKKFGVQVEDVKIQVEDPAGKMIYAGPEKTVAEIKDLAKTTKMGVQIEGQLMRVAFYVNEGMPFKEAMEKNGSPLAAEEVGGRMDVDRKKIETVHSLSINDKMRDSVVYEGQPQFADISPDKSADMDRIIAELLQATSEFEERRQRSIEATQAFATKGVEEKILKRQENIRLRFHERLNARRIKEGLKPLPYLPKTEGSMASEAFRTGIGIGEKRGLNTSAEYSVDKAVREIAKEEGVREINWLIRAGRSLNWLTERLKGVSGDNRQSVIYDTLKDLFGADRLNRMSKAAGYSGERLFKSVQEIIGDRLTFRYTKGIQRIFKTFAQRGQLENPKMRMLTPDAKIKMKDWLDRVPSKVNDLGITEPVLKGRNFEELKSWYEGAMEIIVQSRNEQMMVINGRRWAAKDASDKMTGEAIIASIDLTEATPKSDPRDRGVIKNYMVDKNAIQSNVALMAFGKENSLGYAMFYEELRAGDTKAKALEWRGRSQLETVLKTKDINDMARYHMQSDIKPIKIGKQTIGMTDSERMYFTATWQREEGRMKLLQNGWVLKRLSKTSEVTTTGNIETNWELAQDILKTITPSEQAIVDKIVDIGTAMGPEGNEVSRKLYGRDLFNEKRYFGMAVENPGVSTDEELDRKFSNKVLEGLGMTKETREHKLALKIGDIFEQFEEHNRMMSKYIALTIPIRNVLNALNSQSAQLSKVLTKHFGTIFIPRQKITLRILAGLEAYEHSGIKAMFAILSGNVGRSVLSWKPGPFVSNRVGGSMLYASELGHLPGFLGTKYLARAFLPTSKLLSRKNREIVNYLKENGYLRDRWDSDISRIYIPLPTERYGQSNTMYRMRLRWIQQKALSPMKHAEMSNAIQAFKTLIANKYTWEQARDIIEKITRSTQNSSSALEDSNFIQEVKRDGYGGIFPFLSQVVVSRNLVVRDWLKRDMKGLFLSVLGLLASCLAIAGFNELRRHLQGTDKKKELEASDRVSQLTTDITDLLLPGSGVVLDPAVRALTGTYRGGGSSLMIDRPISQGFQTAASMVRGISEGKEIPANTIINLIDFTGQLAGLPTGGPAQFSKMIANAASEESAGGPAGGSLKQDQLKRAPLHRAPPPVNLPKRTASPLRQDNIRRKRQ